MLVDASAGDVRMTELHCPECGNAILVRDPWDIISLRVRCPKCKTWLVLNWCEVWDGEEEYGWFQFEFDW